MGLISRLSAACLNLILEGIEILWFAACVLIVVASTSLKERGPLGRYLHSLTFISGRSDDTNARLCLFLRLLYALAPPPFTHDAQELYFGRIFLKRYHLVFIWVVKLIGIRAIPPLLLPLYVKYQVRAAEVRMFLERCILSRGVTQVVIIGAGFDTAAYRTRAIRIDPVQGRYVTFFEVDRARVQKEKTRLLRERLTDKEFSYFVEGVRFVECELGQDSLIEALIRSGFDPYFNTAVVWEGVTYYLSKEDVNSTLRDLHLLMNDTKLITQSRPARGPYSIESVGTTTTSSISISTPIPFKPEITTNANLNGLPNITGSELLEGTCTVVVPEKTTADSSAENGIPLVSSFSDSTSPCGSAIFSDSITSSNSCTCDSFNDTVQCPKLGKCYLFLDYIKELNREESPWVWQKCLELFDMSGNCLKTTFNNINECLEPYCWQIKSIKTSDDTMKEIANLNNPYFKLLVDSQALVAKCAPQITTVECELNRSCVL